MPVLQHFLHKWTALLIIIMGMGAFVITSAFFSVYSVAVDTILVCFYEHVGKHDGRKQTPFFKSLDLTNILNFKEQKEGTDNPIYMETM